MDRALGAHPDKRTAAYESIFGRPSASHHQYQRPPPQSTVTYAQGYHQHTEYAAQNYYYQQQQYDPRYDAQVAYEQAVQQTYPQQSYSPSYRQQAYYVQQQQQQQQMQLQQPQQQQQQQQQYAMYNQPHQVQHNNLAPPDHYARSLASSSRSAGIISPQPSIHEQIAPGTDAMVREGMTPAQAYQAQVYSSNYSNYPSPNVGPGQLVSTTLQESRSQRNARNSGQGPQILLGIEPPDSRLDLDFLTEGGYEAKRAEVEGGGTGLGRSGVCSLITHHKYIIQRNFLASSSTSPQSSQDYRYSDGSLDYHGVAGPSSRPYPLQLDTALNVGSSTLETHSPASSTYVDHVSPAPSSTYVDHISPAPSSPRLSGESTRTLPKHMNSKRERTFQDRSRSMSATSSQTKAIIGEQKQSPRPSIPNFTGDRHTPSPHTSQSRRTPIVYPALLSRVAEAFRERITLSERVKDGLTYSDCFDGREAVDKIAYIIKTTDRNLALLLGRALDAQKFFHDVTYDHRLRDSPYELFQFRTAMPTPFVSGEVSTVHGDHNGQIRPSLNQMDSAVTGSSRTDSTTGGPNATTMSADEAPLPSGVFTLLTDCYSPTCSRDSLCYSIACPRRLEQQARLNMKPQPGLKRSISKESLGDPVVSSHCIREGL